MQRFLLKLVQISAEWPHRSASFGEKGKLVVGRQDQSMKILQMILYKLIITHHTINWLSSFDDHHIILIAIDHWDQPMKTWYMLQYDGGQPEKMCCFYGQCPNRGRGGDVQPYRDFFCPYDIWQTMIFQQWSLYHLIGCRSPRTFGTGTFLLQCPAKCNALNHITHSWDQEGELEITWINRHCTRWWYSNSQPLILLCIIGNI